MHPRRVHVGLTAFKELNLLVTPMKLDEMKNVQCSNGPPVLRLTSQRNRK